ncbi:putative membrane protein insertion efficiency factor, partial [Ochromonadaceae sp. CCMP2298]
VKKAMLSSIKWYKSSLSPMLPKACRFLPTCSSYGLEAIETFGPWRGGLLTVWRIFRCNPFGGSGYDPPVWPPPGYFAGS